MRKFFVFTVLIFFILNVQAQWYSKYGVNDINDLSEEQLQFALQKSEKNLKSGKILTYAGLGASTVGLAISIHATAHWVTDPLNPNHDEMTAGGLFLMMGLGAMVVGVPLWAVNASRRNKIEIALIKFNTESFLMNNQSAHFRFNQNSILGLSVKINL